ncbi:MAG TPA: cation-translocating P-type ATPase [Myxococcota bacterium]|nr:cation-translocating P-type ATPase [Myxococcota bacterium]
MQAKEEIASRGLTETEAARRLEEYGPNALPRGDRRSLLRIVRDVFREPMFTLLIAAGFVYLFIGDLGEALMLLGFAFVNVMIAAYQESKTEHVLEALRDLTSPRALVIRDGTRRRIPGSDVVRGDSIVLQEGDRVPADAVLISCGDLEVDESLLTGESAAVRKVTWDGILAAARPGGDDLPFVYSGSMVVRGHGIGEVRATGAETEIGRIGRALGSIKSEPTLLHRQTRHMVRIVATVGLSLSLLVFVLYGTLRGGWLAGLLAGITLAMATLPQEFPLVLTVFLVMGAWRISQRRVLTRRSAAIEALGAATVLCTDKTGTLTLNRMSVAELHEGREIHAVNYENNPELPEQFHTLVEFAILASAKDPFDPMEKAFLELGEHYLAQTEHIHRDWEVVHEYGLSPDLLAMSQVWKAVGRPEHVVAAKGAPEAIADLCHYDAAQLDELRGAVAQMAKHGLRVLAVAKASFRGEEWPPIQHDFTFELLGLVGLLDPLRPGVCEAIHECHTAGMKVVMITGDHPVTALAIARNAGITTDSAVVDGEEVARASDEELRERVRNAAVFARIMPEHKLRLVNAFKANGEIVAMTGDGVNDAPALKSAHIGIAMGGRGTDVAREAASIVLLDDDFGSIVSAVRLGRRIYDNLRKAMAYILAIHVPIAGLSVLPLVLGWPLLFSPVHIVFLELVIDPVCSIVFEAEQEEEGVMRRPPRDSQAPLFSPWLLGWSLLQGATVLLVVGTMLMVALHRKMPPEEARALSFVTLVTANFALIFINRSGVGTLFAGLWRPNPILWAVIVAALSVLAVVVYLPGLRTMFAFGPLHADDLTVCLSAGIGTFLALALLKRVAGAGPLKAP